MNILVATSYLLKEIPNCEETKAKLNKTLSALDIKGTLIIADEGINFTIAGSDKSINSACEFLNEIFESKMQFQITKSSFIPFRKLKVKVKEEVISFREGKERKCKKDNFLPKESRGSHLTADEWDELLEKENVKVIDTRNHYEYAMGHFEKAINPKTENFSELTDWVKKNLDESDKDRPIAMYCTGGIRCEKSTAYMKKLGFSNVYHLNGGILQYMEKRKGEESKWRGNLFIFDDRIAIDSNLRSVREHVLPSND